MKKREKAGEKKPLLKRLFVRKPKEEETPSWIKGDFSALGGYRMVSHEE